jgi:threonine/homoserine/homoserine lactone efflux protein
MSLEQRYRQVSRLFPADWRAEHEEELIGTLLDAAEPGRRVPTAAEAVDLVRGALVLRGRAWLRRLAATLSATRPVRLGGTVAVVVLSAVGLVLAARSSLRDMSADFVVTSLIVALIPGTGVVYTVSSAIGTGRRRGSFAAVGCTLGIVPHILAAMLGLSGLMQAGAAVFEVVRWAGVAYLVFVGLMLFRSGDALRFAADSDRGLADSIGLVVRRGVLLNLLNPKLTVFFFAFLPQFLDTPPRMFDARLLGLGGVFMLVTLVVFVAYAWASAAVRERVLESPAAQRWIQRSLGSVLIGSAARLAITDR